MTRQFFLIASMLGVVKAVARKPEFWWVIISQISGVGVGVFTMYQIIHGNEVERAAIAQVASASNYVCTVILVLAILSMTKK